jgi:ATP-grasp domain
MEALVIARATSPAWDILHLLSRAGFSVDIVTTSRYLRLSRFARTVHSVTSDKALAPSAYDVVRIREKPYDWVIATDDLTLRALAQDWAPGTQLKFLPSTTPENLAHLCSKIGLSRVLSAGGIRTPPFRIAQNHEEAIEAASAIGYPVMLKVDFSGGGEGVHECAQEADIVALRHLFSEQPLLVQKKIEGTVLDLSAIYFEGELVHFTYSTYERTSKRFGISVVRTYYPLTLVDDEIFAELSALGNVLGASGFVNIACIEGTDGVRHYIEADMRPNTWADFSRFFGEDAAPRIRNWFCSHARLTKASAVRLGARQAPLTIPYFLRLDTWELLTNRYAVWRFIPLADARLVRRLLLVKFLSFVLATRTVSFALLKIKSLVPLKLRSIARRLLTALTDGL